MSVDLDWSVQFRMNQLITVWLEGLRVKIARDRRLGLEICNRARVREVELIIKV